MKLISTMISTHGHFFPKSRRSRGVRARTTRLITASVICSRRAMARAVSAGVGNADMSGIMVVPLRGHVWLFRWLRFAILPAAQTAAVRRSRRVKRRLRAAKLRG
jgi:hypothetical protein